LNCSELHQRLLNRLAEPVGIRHCSAKIRQSTIVDANYSVSLSHPFVIGEAELKKLARLLKDRIGDVDIHASCADDISRSFKSIDDLLAFENTKAQAIVRLDLSARSTDFSKRASIEFSGSRWRGIALSLSARDDVVTRLRSEILDICAGMRPWYALLHRIDFFSVSFFAYLVLWLSILAAVAFKWVKVRHANETDPAATAYGQLVVAGVVGLLFATGFALNRFRDTLFPRAVFRIGQGRARFEHLERIQWTVMIGFVVSFVAGVIPLLWL
jgi:hypothetical protein